MNKNLLRIFLIISLMVSVSTSVFATEEINIENVQGKEMLDTIVEGPTILDNNYKKSLHSNIDEDTLEYNKLFNTMGTNRRLWNDAYRNTYNVKKRITATNYSYPWDNPGTVYIDIRNTGNSIITVNIYKGTREADTIDAGYVYPNQTRQFIVHRADGFTECHGNTCFAKQDFTVSAYNVSSQIAFNATADIRY